MHVLSMWSKVCVGQVCVHMCLCMREASAARRLMTSVVAAAPDRSRVLHRAYFLTAAASLYCPPTPQTSSPARAQKANALHLTAGARGAAIYVCVCVRVFV